MISSLIFFAKGDLTACLMWLLSIVLALISIIIEIIFKVHLSLFSFGFAMLYSMGSYLGDPFNLYYHAGWFDKTLHFSAGILIAMLGTVLPKAFNNDVKLIFSCVFALLVAVTVAVLWEFYEFGIDKIFGRDMQKDTVSGYLNIGLIDTMHDMLGALIYCIACLIRKEPLFISIVERETE